MIEAQSAALRFEFENDYGERWLVEIDATRRTGLLRGDETNWDPIEIHDGVIAGGFGLSGEEFEWLAGVWIETTGEELQSTWINRVETFFKTYCDSCGEN